MQFAGFVYLLVLFTLCSVTNVCGQIVQLEPKEVYTKVFVDTDNFGASYLQVLEETYPKIKTDSIKFSMLNDLAYYWHTRNLKQSVKFVNIGLKLTKEKKDTLWYGRFQITQGAILLRQEKLDSALVVLHEAKTKVFTSDLPMLNTQIGYVYERKGEIDMAANYAKECLELGKSTNDKRVIAVAYSDISNLFWKQSKWEKGLEYGLKSLSYFEERQINDLDYDFTLYVVGNNYLALKKYNKAKQYFEHAIAIGERYGFYNNLSDIYISITDLYAFLKEYKNAHRAGKKAIKYAEMIDNNFLLMRAYLSVGKLEYLEGKYQSAVTSLQKSITVATSDFGDSYYLSQAYESLGKSLAGTHNYKDAYLAFAEYDKLKNKIFTAEADQRISLLQTEFEVAQKESTIQVQETRLKKQQSRQTLIIVIASLLLLLLIVTLITVRNNRLKSRLLEKQNRENQFLLKEIHHRVKNNLGIVSSLLALQAAKIKDPKVIEVMDESRNRVYSMSMIHQRLYQGVKLSTIEMKDYFINLGQHILDAFGAENRIDLIFEMEPIEVDVDTAVPLGLITNEILNNALKYAFPNHREGKIVISLKKDIEKNLVLKIADNGIGQKQDEFIHGTGFGTHLIELLTQQLDGKMDRFTQNGTAYVFKFKDVKS